MILATACLSVVTLCQWICPSSLLHQLSHNCRVCLHCCAATSDFLLLLAHCNHSRDYSTGTVESHVTYAIGRHMTPCSQSFQYFNHMSFSESSVCVQCAKRSSTEGCIMVVQPLSLTISIEPSHAPTRCIIAERRERSERSEANNRVLFEIPRYLYIYIYIYICLSARALHKTVHTLRKS